jgi:hypothetical protein
VIIGVLLLASGFPVRSEQDSRPQTGRERADTGTSRDTQRGPLTIEQAERLVRTIKAGIEYESRVSEIIQSRGVSFFADEPNLSALRDNGATEAVIGLVKKVAPVRPKTTGTFVVRCTPAECEIKLNDQLLGTTTNGRFVISDVPAGTATVRFEKAGYDTHEESVQVTVEPRPEIWVALLPDNATKAENGKRLLALMLNALGMDSEAKDFPHLTGSGSMTSYEKGKQSDWNFDLAVGSSSQIEMTATSAVGNLIYQCNGQKCNERKKGRFSMRGSKSIPPGLAEGLQANLRAFAQYHLGPILQSLLSPSVRLAALKADAKPDADQHFRAELDDFVFDVALGPDLLPTVVKYESKGGLGSGRTISFGDYGNIAGAEKSKNGGTPRYPKRTTVRLPDADQHGIEVRLDKVELWATFRDSDFGK